MGSPFLSFLLVLLGHVFKSSFEVSCIASWNFWSGFLIVGANFFGLIVVTQGNLIFAIRLDSVLTTKTSFIIFLRIMFLHFFNMIPPDCRFIHSFMHAKLSSESRFIVFL